MKNVVAKLGFIFVFVTFAGLAGCSFVTKRSVPKPDPSVAQTALDQSMSQLSLQQLYDAALVFRVAFDRSNDSWHGPEDDVPSGCKISSKEAENGLAALKPWIEKRTSEEAERLERSPKSYRPPVDAETCDRNCSCIIGIKIFEAAKLDDYAHAKVKELKRLRTRFEAQGELLTNERSEICAEAATWICRSEMLKALKAVP